jgi:hypothetical protein
MAFATLGDGTPPALIRREKGLPEVLPIFGGSLVKLASEEKNRLHVLHQDLEANAHPYLRGEILPKGEIGLEEFGHGEALAPEQLVKLILKGAALTFHGFDLRRRTRQERGWTHRTSCATGSPKRNTSRRY